MGPLCACGAAPTCGLLFMGWENTVLAEPLLTSAFDTAWLCGQYGESRAIFKQRLGVGLYLDQRMHFNDSFDRAFVKYA